ncbi:MAG: hypothetical protein P1U52_00665 [Porticoccaceae bacterium]|nr:hypothetical protein [Porticoccaceae bacterium]
MKPTLPIKILPRKPQIIRKDSDAFTHYTKGPVIRLPHHMLVLVGKHLRCTQVVIVAVVEIGRLGGGSLDRPAVRLIGRRGRRVSGLI